MSMADMTAAVQQLVGSPQGPSASQQLVENMPAWERALVGAGEAFNTLGRGTKQKGMEFLNYIGDLPPDQLEAFKRETAAQRELAQPVLSTPAGLAGNLVGNVAAIAPTAMLPGANTVAGSAAIGALSGALMPTVGDESSLTNAALGGGLGAAGGAIGRGISRLNQPVRARLSAEAADLAAQAQARGIPLDAADLSGSRPLQSMRATLENLPLVGGRAQADKAAKMAAFNREVGKTFGANADALTPEVMAAAKSGLSAGFDDLTARNILSPDQTFVQQIADLTVKARREFTPDLARILNNKVDDALALIDDQTGQIPGKAYRRLDTELGKMMKGGGDKAALIGDLRQVLRETMDRSISPQDQAAWRALRKQWASMKTVEPLVAKNAEGNVSPRMLLNRVATQDRSTAYGGGDLAELGRIGKLFVAEPIPDSGTAQRTFWQNLLTGYAPTVGNLAAGSGLGAATLAATGDPYAAAGVGALGGLGIPLAARAALKNPRWLTEGLLSDEQLTRNPYVLDALRALPASLSAGLLGTVN
jgi:hypothetical protein